MAVNHPAERSFGGLTRQIQYFGQISHAHAGGMSQVHKNGDTSCGFEIRKQNKKAGEMPKGAFFLILDREMIDSLLIIAMMDASSFHKKD
eukprot:8088157-Ditylum_brightwellii.AAC.1